jgi:serine/threonine-protein kinase
VRTCPTCQAAVEDGARFCPHDGTSLADEPPTAVDAAAPASERTAVDAAPPVEPPTAPTQVTLPAGTRDDLIGRLIDNRYRVLARISAGSVGVVYRGEHVQLHRPVAVKVLHAVHNERDDYVRRFEREALAASKLNHPACVSVLDFGQFEGRPYLVMEYVAGRTLADVLKQAGALPLREAVLLTRLILSALRHTHKLGVIHRDIKPANIMLCDEAYTGAQLRILDFGLAKSLAPEDPAGRGVTLRGVVCGTPGYLSPEQAAGLPLDGRSDLYSVGALLFTMVCGRRPFIYDDPVEEMRAHITRSPPVASAFRSEVSGELDAVIARALEKDPARRHQSADEFITALLATPEAAGLQAGATLGPGAAAPAAPAPAPRILPARPASLGEQPTRILAAQGEPSAGGPGDSWSVLRPSMASPAWTQRPSGLRVAAPEDEPLEVPRDRRGVHTALVVAAGVLLAAAVAAALVFGR